MKNVCLLAPLPPPIGGIAQWTKNILSYEQEEINFHLINTSTKRSAVKRNLFHKIFLSGFQMLHILHQLSKMLKKEEIDCLHIATSGSLGFIRDYHAAKKAKKKHKKVILHLHFGRIPNIFEKRNKEYKLFMKVNKYVDKIVCMDLKTFSVLQEYEETRGKVCYIPNPISYHHELIPQPKKEKTICFIGWMIKTKGIEELIDSWNVVGKQNPDWSLHLIGPCNSEYKKKLSAMVQNSNVVFLGELSHRECMEELQKSSVFILPSYTEGFPNVILEAMMNSNAIIATNVGDIQQMLLEQSGLLILPKSVADITQSLTTLLKSIDLRETLSLNAYKRVNKCYSVEVVFHLLKDLWN